MKKKVGNKSYTDEIDIEKEAEQSVSILNPSVEAKKTTLDKKLSLVASDSEALKVLGKQTMKDFIEDGPLTEKEAWFCLFYLQSFSAGQAARKSKVSITNSHIAGMKLLEKTKIQVELYKLKKLISADLILDVNMILHRHAKVAFNDITDYVNFKNNKIKSPITDPLTGDMIDERETSKLEFEFTDSDQIDGTLIKKMSMGKNGPVIEIEDRGKSLEFLTNFYMIPKLLDRQKLQLDKDKFQLQKDIIDIDKDMTKEDIVNAIRTMSDEELKEFMNVFKE